jgi:hypothetical protein
VIFGNMDQIEQELFPRLYAARRRACPTCGAKAGKPCLAHRERVALRDVHQERYPDDRMLPPAVALSRNRGDAS